MIMSIIDSVISYQKIELKKQEKKKEDGIYSISECVNLSDKSYSKIPAVLFYDSPVNRIVAICGKFLQIFDSVEYKKVKSIPLESNYHHGCKWDNGSVICCGSHRLESYSINEPYQILKEFKGTNELYRLLKINEEEFVARGTKCIFIFHYKQKKIIWKLIIGQIYFANDNLSLSKKSNNCFYVPTSTRSRRCKSLILVDFRNMKVIKEFKEHEPTDTFETFCVSENSRKEEIVICVPKIDTFLVYNTTNIKFCETNFESKTRYFGYSEVSKTFNIRNKYLICGTCNGLIVVYEICKNGEIRRIITENFHSLKGSSFVWDMCVLSIESDKVRIAVSQNQIFILEIRGLRIRDDQEINDILERVKFLMENKDDYVSNKNENLQKRVFVGVKITGVFSSSFLRTLFC